VVKHPFPRRLIKNVENPNLPVMALAAVRDLRVYLDLVEADALKKAKDLGASVDDIAQALGITRGGTYYKLRNLDQK